MKKGYISNNNRIMIRKITVHRILSASYLLISLIAAFIPPAFATAVDLDAGAKSFFIPVVQVITDYSSTAIFASGVVAGLAAPGDLRMRFGACAGGMAVAGLVVLAGKKMLGVA